jgi:plasmid rolling circle replication initiator protein Rep
MEKTIPAAPRAGNQRLTDYSSNERPWAAHRAQADFLETIYLTADEEWMAKYSGRISQCAQVLEYGFRTVDFGQVEFKFRRTSFCRVRFCAICQWRRSLKWRARFLEAMPEIENLYPKARWVFLTLTVKNCPAQDLRATVQHMANSFVRLTQT